MRRVLRAAICLLLGGASALPAATRIAEVRAVAPEEGWTELRWERAGERLPVRLRANPALARSLKVGQRGRVVARAYGADWWLDHWWPLEPEAARALGDPSWWRARAAAKDAARPAGGLLGLAPEGNLLAWDDRAHRRGFFLVPVAFALDGEGASPPPALEEAARLRAYLAPTVHHDLPWLLFSLRPEHDDPRRGEEWIREAFGQDVTNVTWVSPLEEFLPAWRAALGVPYHAVAGQEPIAVPQFLAIDPGGALAVRYEGWRWPRARLERALDAAPRPPPPFPGD
jgi:hypothetical protein